MNGRHLQRVRAGRQVEGGPPAAIRLGAVKLNIDAVAVQGARDRGRAQSLAGGRTAKNRALLTGGVVSPSAFRPLAPQHSDRAIASIRVVASQSFRCGRTETTTGDC